MKVFLLSRRALAISKVRADFARRRATDPAPYGLNAAEQEPEIEISYSDGPSEPTWLSTWTWIRFGFDLPHTLRNLRAMRRADIIWTVLEWEWLGASFLQRLGLLQGKPIIANSVFMARDIYSSGRARRWLWPRLMTRHTHLTMHARSAMEATARALPSKTFHLLLFGISTRAFPVTPPRRLERGSRPIRVYSIGDDPGRDWETMLRAFGNDPRFEVRITCRWLDPALVARYTNLHVPADVTADDQRAFYQWADVVVMPMKENDYSGITVVCEAAATGRPVVCSRTGGVATYFDEDDLFYVPVGDADTMRDTVLHAGPDVLLARARAAQARFVRDDYSADGMTRRHLDLSRALLGHQNAAREDGGSVARRLTTRHDQAGAGGTDR